MRLKHLKRLNLGQNHLSGSIPSELSQLKSLAWLDVAQNHLTGPLAAELGTLEQLETWMQGVLAGFGKQPGKTAQHPVGSGDWERSICFWL